MKNIPQRTCMGCNTKKNKTDLIRIVRTNPSHEKEKDNETNNKYEITIDKTGKLEGRGAYICNNVQCLEKAIKSKKLERVLNTRISEGIFADLKKLIDGGEFIG